MNSPKCWWKRSPWPKHCAVVLLAALLAGPARAASGQPARPSASTSATVDTVQAARDKAAAEAMRTTNEAEMQPAPATPPPVVATAPPAAGQVAVPEKPAVKPAPKSVSSNLKWVLGIVVGGVMGFLLARILTNKPKEMPVALEDEGAQVRRRNHRRGQGYTPASREEQRISRMSEQEFMQAPMRQTPTPPDSPPTNIPAPPLANSPTANKSKNAKPARPMPATPPPPAIPAAADELMAASATETAAVPVTPAGPVQFYAPAPDVPSIEHRKLSPNPLPQMPLFIKLAHPEATKAEYSFSPQADQSRIIGNGVRELKEFFAFELPPTEQFTTIKHLKTGILEKRGDTWHVVQKASIALD